VEQLLDRVTTIIAYPADDPRATLLLMLAFVALGLLIAVVLLAVASPRRTTPDEVTPANPDESSDERGD